MRSLPKLNRILWCLVLLLPSLGSVAWLTSVNWSDKLSTDVMELIPEESPSPELALARSILSTSYSNRISVLLRNVTSEAALETYTSHLRESPLVAEVRNLKEGESLAAVGALVYAHRLELLFPKWLAGAKRALGNASPDAAQLADYGVGRLDATLRRPDAFAFEELIPADPLLLVPSAMEAFDGVGAGVDLPDGVVLLEVKLAVSALSKEGQAPVFELFDEAERLARAEAPDLEVIDSGANRYAAATEAHMRSEVNWLNIATLSTVLALCFLLCRRVWLVAHVFTMLAISLLLSFALMTLVFDRINVFALVFGCVLCGVIVDYGLHAYLHGTSSSESSGIRSFLRPFLVSCGSTLAGFSILLFSGLPVLRQMGAFVAFGLTLAALVTLVYRFGLLRGTSDVRNGRLMAGRSFRRGQWLLPLVALASVAVLPFIRWEDDIRSLKYPLPKLEAEEAAIRNLQGEERQIVIVTGATYADSRRELEALDEWLAGEVLPAESNFNQSVLNAAPWLPTEEQYAEGHAFAAEHPDFAGEFSARLDAAGYDASVFAPFVEDWQHYVVGAGDDAAQYEALMHSVQGALSGMLAGILGSDTGITWWVTLVDGNLVLPDFPAGVKALSLNQVESLSEVLATYRHRTLLLSSWAVVGIVLILILAFNLRIGLLIACVPAVAVCAGASGLYLAVGNLGMFHLIGVFLGFCLVLDYAVFSWIGWSRERVIPLSVLVSALTTGASFLILSFSRIPSIHALGLAVAAVTFGGLILNYLFIPPVSERFTAHGTVER